MSASEFEIALLLDANISSDMLGQIEILADGIGQDGQFRGRGVVFGPIGSDSAVRRRYESLCRCLGSAGAGSELLHLPLRRSIHPFDTLNLVRSPSLSQCDLWHCFSLSLLDSLLGLPANRMVRPCCLTISCWPSEGIVRRLVRRSSSFAKVICFTDDLREALIKGGFPGEKCMVIPPEPPGEQRSIDKLTARRLLNLKPDLKLVLADAHVSACSNQRQLSWAMAVVGQFRPGVRVMFPGCDPRLSGVKHLDTTLTPSCLGIYPGEKYEPEVLYAAADVLALPGTGPVSPVPLLRAGRVSLPVVASDSPYFRRYLKHEENALLFAPNAYSTGNRTSRRIRPLAGAIARLLDDGNLAGELGERLAQDINSSFVPGGSLSAHLSLYQNILSKRQPAKT